LEFFHTLLRPSSAYLPKIIPPKEKPLYTKTQIFYNISKSKIRRNLMKEKIDEDFLRQTYKTIGRGYIEYQKYFFRLLLVGGTIKDRQKAVNEFEDKMNKMEIRKGNVDVRIEMLCTAGDRIKIKGHIDDIITQMDKTDINKFLLDESISVVITQSGKPFKEEHEE